MIIAVCDSIQSGAQQHWCRFIRLSLSSNKQQQNSNFIHITDDFVVKEAFGIPKASYRSEHKGVACFVQVFHRWTFQLMNAITVHRRHFVNLGGVNALLINCHTQRKRRALLWDLKTGELHSLPCRGFVYMAFCFAKLIVLFSSETERTGATLEDETKFFVTMTHLDTSLLTWCGSTIMAKRGRFTDTACQRRCNARSTPICVWS